MSDRGYIAVALESMIKVLEIEVKGMEAENKWCEFCGDAPAYREAFFKEKAEEIRGISKEIKQLAGR